MVNKNKEILFKMFNELKKEDDSLVILYYSDEYFLGDQDILYFRSSKIKKNYWTMAIWANYDKDWNISGAHYIAEPDEFTDKFRPGRTSIDTENPDEFLDLISKVEKDSVNSIIEYIFGGNKEEYKKYKDKKTREKELNKIYLGFLQKTIPEMSKKVPFVRGVSIVDKNFTDYEWKTYPGYSVCFWVKMCKDMTSYFTELNDVINEYNKKLAE